jgi:hypothetical protein
LIFLIKKAFVVPHGKGYYAIPVRSFERLLKKYQAYEPIDAEFYSNICEFSKTLVFSTALPQDKF